MRDSLIGVGGTSYSFLGLPLAEWAAVMTITYMAYKIVVEYLDRRRKRRCD